MARYWVHVEVLVESDAEKEAMRIVDKELDRIVDAKRADGILDASITKVAPSEV